MGVKEVIEKTKPAVVYVICIVDGKVRFPKPNSEGEPTNRSLSQRVKIGGSGSGFIIDSDGYIATNGHVLFSFTHANVQDDPYVKQLLFEKVAEEREIPFEYVLNYGKIDTARRNISIQFGEAISSFDVPRKADRGRVVGLPSPASEKDIAIIKIDRKDLVPLQLAESTATSVGDRVFVIGYPGVVKDHPYLSEETGLEPTVTAGIISAKRKTKDGSPCIQTDAVITHGNSGGPVIIENGEVIGIATFGSMGRGGEVHGYNFLRPSELVEEFLQETGVRNVMALRRIDELEKLVKNTTPLAVIVEDHGIFQMDSCKHNAKGYCNHWRFPSRGKWAKFKKDGEIYRIKTSPEYCGLCNAFDKGEKSTAERKIDNLVRLMKSHGSWKKDSCVHNEEDFCTYWGWEKNPEFKNLAGKKLKMKMNAKGRFNMETNSLYCVACSAHKRKTE